MKKLISVLCVFAMLFSLCVASVNAEGNSVAFVKDASSTETALVYNLVLTSDIEVTTVQLYYDLTAVLATGATVTAVKGDSNTFNVNTKTKSLAVTKVDSEGTFSGTITLGKITITLPAESSAFKIEQTSKVANRNVTNKINNGTTTHIDSYTIGTLEFTPAPAVKTITKTATDAIVNNATALKDKETDVEIGGAAGFAFTIPEGVTLDNNMIWSLTTAGGKLYSEKINAGLSVLTGDVQVAATFITGTHKGADAANTEITAVNGIFKAGEDFYFTDAADAKNQAAAE